MSDSRRLPALDGLRAVSILIVVAAHSLVLLGTTRIPGGVGVTIFFFISGFVITRLLLEETPAPRLGPFYVRRIFRLGPGLLVFVLVSWASMKAFGFTVPWADIQATLFYYANYYNIYGHYRLQGPFWVVSPIAVTWSLAVEEHFYILFPVALVLLRRHPVWLTRSLWIAVGATLAWRVLLVFGFGTDSIPRNRIYMGTDTRLDSIAYGCLLSSLIWRADTLGDNGCRRWLERAGRPTVIWAALVAFTVSIAVRATGFKETLAYTIQGLALIPLFVGLFWSNTAPMQIRALLESRAMVMIGWLSYSLYLYHFLGLALGEVVLHGHTKAAQLALGLALSVAGTLMSYYLVETPARRLGMRLSRRI